MATKFKNVAALPDLLQHGEVDKYPGERIFKFRIEVRGGEIFILSDSPHPRELELFLQALGVPEIQYELCG